MRPNQWNKKTTYQPWENICKQCDQQRINIQNIRRAHTTQCQKEKKSKYGPKT